MDFQKLKFQTLEIPSFIKRILKVQIVISTKEWRHSKQCLQRWFWERNSAKEQTLGRSDVSSILFWLVSFHLGIRRLKLFKLWSENLITAWLRKPTQSILLILWRNYFWRTRKHDQKYQKSCLKWSSTFDSCRWTNLTKIQLSIKSAKDNIMHFKKWRKNEI